MHALITKLPPAVLALLLQTAAFASVFLFVRTTQIQMPALLFALLCGTIAAALSRIAGLAKWWLLIQLLFVPALVLMLSLDISPNLFLAAFLILLVVYWSTFRTQVPLYLSSRKVWQALELLLPSPAEGGGVTSDLAGVVFQPSRMASSSIRGEGGICKQGENCSDRSLTPALSRREREPCFSFMDLGSGIGGVLTHLAAVRPDGLYHGVEAAPLPFLLSLLRIRLGGFQNCRVQWGSLWSCNLAQYDVVFAYLSPVPMTELWQKVQREMRPGTLFISNTFAVAEQPPQDTITLDDLHHSTLHIWRF